ncbi:MAG: hypothetical protein U5J62_04715 [Desulfurivibrio sp.]|nr:hypothetical protein [Desulfurivibrio sp.]
MWTQRVVQSRSKRVLPLVAVLLLVLSVVIQQAFSREVVPEDPGAPGNYASLANLVELIGGDAAKQFNGFYDAGSVRIEPFPVLGEFPARRVSKLGATLADQLAASINSAEPASFATGGREQVMRGVIQEVDGYLRLHVSGRNSRGQWRSYVANVEMSEAVYRAMHTYVSY